MTQSTARTGPSGLVRPTPDRAQAILATVQQGLDRAAQFETALDQLRDAFTSTEHPTFPARARHSLETALGLAEKAPELYAMPDNVAQRFRIVTVFLREALDAIDESNQR